MKLKEKTNNPPFCNYFYFFQFGPLLFLYFSHLWTFFGQDRCTHPQHKCALPTLYRNHKFRLKLFHPTPNPVHWVRFDYQSKIVSLTFLEWNFWEAPSDRAFKKSASDVWPIISRISVGLQRDSQESLCRDEIQDK